MLRLHSGDRLRHFRVRGVLAQRTGQARVVRHGDAGAQQPRQQQDRVDELFRRRERRRVPVVFLHRCQPPICRGRQLDVRAAHVNADAVRPLRRGAQSAQLVRQSPALFLRIGNRRVFADGTYPQLEVPQPKGAAHAIGDAHHLAESVARFISELEDVRKIAEQPHHRRVGRVGKDRQLAAAADGHGVVDRGAEVVPHQRALIGILPAGQRVGIIPRITVKGAQAQDEAVPLRRREGFTQVGQP